VIRLIYGYINKRGEQNFKPEIFSEYGLSIQALEESLLLTENFSEATSPQIKFMCGKMYLGLHFRLLLLQTRLGQISVDTDMQARVVSTLFLNSLTSAMDGASTAEERQELLSAYQDVLSIHVFNNNREAASNARTYQDLRRHMESLNQRDRK
jgi:hypothetical protein